MTPMDNKGKGIFSKWIVFSTLALVISVWLLMPASQANAETRKAKVNNYINKFEMIPILDVPGHIIAVYERKGDVVFEDGEKAKQTLWGLLDITSGNGTFSGYSLYSFEDGSLTIAKIEGIVKMLSGEKLPVTEGTGKYTKGTGRFQGIEGTVSFKGKQTKPFGGEHKADMELDFVATYTLPAK
jgi:hypothetical protein